MRKDCVRKRQRKTQQITGVMRLANQNCIHNNLNNHSNNDSHQNQSFLSSASMIQQKNLSYYNSCYGQCYQEVNQELQSGSEFNPNSDLTPFNNIKIDSFAASKQQNFKL
jgi:hypothetical protein